MTRPAIRSATRLTPAPHTVLTTLTLALAALLAAPAAQAAEGGSCAQPTFTFRTPKIEIDEHLVLEADQALLEKGGLSKLIGAVRLTENGKEFEAPAMDYDDENRIVTVDSVSNFRNREILIKSQRARFDLDSETGAFYDSDFVLPSRAAHGSSDVIAMSSAGTADLTGASYTTCSPDAEAWQVRAKTVHLDQEKGMGSARNATVRVADVPILWLPYFQFPLDERRRTGLLYPTVGQSQRTGFDVRWPIYFDLAPNYDLMLTPREMTKRGEELSSRFRYLLARGQGQADYEFMNKDKVYGDSRNLSRLQHVNLFNDRTGLEINYNKVSDREYFVDLGGDPQAVATTHLEQTARLTYQAPASYSVQVLAQNFQPIVGTEQPYKRLPEVRFSTLSRNSLFDTRAGVNAQYVRFEGDEAADVEGQRVDFTPYLRYLHDETAWYIGGETTLRYTGYDLTQTGGAQNKSPSRTLPTLSAEGGLRFERLTSGGKLQTLEPRALALYTPYRNQDEIPIFDTGEPDFSFVQLFARNRFSGADRVSDAQDVAGSLTTRIIDPETGLTRWRAAVGQLFRFRTPRIALPNEPAPEAGASEFVSELEYSINQHWTSSAAGQWSPNERRFDRGSLALRYVEGQGEGGRSFRSAYRFRRGLLEQTDLDFSWPIAGQWRIAGHNRYSLREKANLETAAGLVYETCCWAVRASYNRYILNIDGRYNSGVYLQFELKGLTRIGGNRMMSLGPMADTNNAGLDAY